MKNLILLIVLLSSVSISYADNVYVKDTNENKKFEIKDHVIRDNNWNRVYTIKKDGTILDNNWNKVGKIERKH